MRIRIATTVALCGLALAPAVHALPLSGITEAGQLAAFQSVQDQNAALDYWRLINTATHAPDLGERAREVIASMHPRADGDIEPLDAPPALLPGGEMAAEFAELSDYLDDLDRASREPVCDFQVRYEDGYNALLPHLGSMRDFARLLVADARRLALAGDEQGAAARLATVLRMARHLAADRVLISSLVSAAMANLAIQEAHWLLDRTGDVRQVREALLPAIQRFPEHDPHGVEAALRTERDFVASLARSFHGPQAGREFVEMFQLMGGGGHFDSIAGALSSLNGEQFRAQIDQAVDAFDLVFEAWAADDAPIELDRLGERYAAGDFGSVALVVVPAFGKTYEQDAKARSRLESLRERIGTDG